MIFIPSSLKSQQEGSNPVIEEINDSLIRLNKIVINKNNKSISFPAKINMSKGLIEVVLCKTQGKTHESLLTTQISQIELQTALLLLGFNPINKIPGDENTETNNPDSVLVFIEWKEGKNTNTERVEKFIRNKITGFEMKPNTWLFRGLLLQENANLNNDEISMIVTYFDPHAIIELNSPDKNDDRLFYVNENYCLPVETEVEVIIKEFDK